MFNPLVSIIIPVYNGSNYLAEAIDSALAQTYKNIEIIIVNDGSNDNGETEKIALSYGDKIKYFKKGNAGVSSALNLGIEKMNGDYFSWLSHDDLYFENKIESQVSRLQNIDDKYNTVVISSGMLIDGGGKEIIHTKDNTNKIMTGLERFHLYVNGCKYNGLAFLVPKAVFDKYGNFDTSIRYLQDLDMWLRLMYTNIMFIQNPDVITKSRIHSMQLTKAQYDIFLIESKQLYKKSIKLLSTLEPIEKRIAFLKEFYRLTIRDNSKENSTMVSAELKKNGCSYNPVATKIHFFLYNILKKIYKKWFSKFRKV